MQRRLRRGERENGELKWKKTKTKLYIRNGTEIYRNFNISIFNHITTLYTYSIISRSRIISPIHCRLLIIFLLHKPIMRIFYFTLLSKSIQHNFVIWKGPKLRQKVNRLTSNSFEMCIKYKNFLISLKKLLTNTFCLLV